MKKSLPKKPVAGDVPEAKRPVPGKLPEAKRPVPGRLKDTTEWAFSFKYFRQTKDYFGLGTIDGAWAVSLLERLQDFCSQDKEEFFRNAVKKDAYRYHDIDWKGKGVKVSRDFFDWLPKDILDNDEEFPFLQFHISKALGRVVGFWNDDSSLFYVLVLDPLHNIQPSKYSDYKVRPTSPLDCEYSALLLMLERARLAKCQNDRCTVTEAISEISSPHSHINFFYFGIDDDYLETLKEQLKTKSLKDIIESGILANL